jgi:hypothetical protein
MGHYPGSGVINRLIFKLSFSRRHRIFLWTQDDDTSALILNLS